MNFNIFLILLFLSKLVLSEDSDTVGQLLLEINESAADEKEDDNSDNKVESRASANVPECFKRLIEILRKDATKVLQDICQMESYISEDKDDDLLNSRENLVGVNDMANSNVDSCDRKSNIVDPAVQNMVTSAALSTLSGNENQQLSNVSSTNELCETKSEDAKLKAWDKQISVCKQLLQPSFKSSLRSPAVKSAYDTKKRKTLKIRTNKFRKRYHYPELYPGVKDAVWSGWTSWSPCSVSCGPGKQIRFRKCIGNDCEADIEMDEKMCAQPNCDTELFKILKLI